MENDSQYASRGVRPYCEGCVSTLFSAGCVNPLIYVNKERGVARSEVCRCRSVYVPEVIGSCTSPSLRYLMMFRFISPAIVAPEIIDVEIPKDDWVLRRGLMLVAKIIQNLANNIFFGKEPHMIALNDFLKENIVNVTRFLSDLNVSFLRCRVER